VCDSDEDEITIDLIKELGGNIDDLKLINHIKPSDDEIVKLDDHTESELKSLIRTLDFSKFTTESLTISDNEEEDEVPMSTEKNDVEIKAPDSSLKESGSSNSLSDQKNMDDDESDDDSKSTVDKPEFHFLKEKDYVKRSHCVVKTGDIWHKAIFNDIASVEENLKNKYWVPKLEKYAKNVWDKDIENYTHASMKGSKKSETQWMNTVLKSGTLNDKFSTYVLKIQESPVHNLSALETMIDYVSLKSRRPCFIAIENLQELFLKVLLVPDRKLRSFDRNPFGQLSELTGGNKDTRDRYLITWLFEDRLKKLYNKYLEKLEEIGKDNIDKTKVKSISSMQELLAGNPELESILLERLVNKLGDPVRVVAAKAMYLLSHLLEQHPVMKWIVVGEVERLLYRQNISSKAQYYGICFLSQILLEKFNQDNLAAKLITIYFSFFKMVIKKGEVNTKLMKALLTGVNRAFPYASITPEDLDAQLETMHKLVHIVSFNTSIQALTLLFQVMDSRDAVTDRFYMALYKKTLDPALSTSSKQVMFLNLIYKALKIDPSAVRVKAFIKRLLQVCVYQSSQLICGLLYLLSELITSRPELGSIQTMFHSNTEMETNNFNDDSDEDEHYQDVMEGTVDNISRENMKAETKGAGVPGWTFKSEKKNEVHNHYNPSGRNPLYCGADKSLLWELDFLVNHFHPSAALFAKNLADNVPIKYSGDPLGDFTLTRFLDRFVFRNPKKNPEKNKPTTVLGKRNIYKPTGVKAIAPDSKDFLNRDAGNVPTDELFMYRYFQEKTERRGVKNDDEVASVTSEEFNDYLDNLGGRSKDFDDELDFANGLGDTQENQISDEEGDKLGDERDISDDEMKDLSSGDEDLPDQMEDENFHDKLDEEDFDGGDSLDEEGFDGGDSLDEEDFDGGNSDEEIFDNKVPKTNVSTEQSKSKRRKVAKFDPSDLSSLLADAEEFSHLLEENEDRGMSSSVVNKDKSSKKQLMWEDKREKMGHSWKSKKGNRSHTKFTKSRSKTKKTFRDGK